MSADLIEKLKRLVPIVRGDHLVPLLAQYHLREQTNVRFIVHNQDQLSISRYISDLQVKFIRQHAELPSS
jgi:cellobiose-specific phosphotransferase system component IIA